MMNDHPRTLASVSVSLASLCLALLALSVPSSSDPIVNIPWAVRVLLSGAGATLLIAAALLIDWSVDSLGPADWDAIDGHFRHLGDRPVTRKYNFFFARARLYGGGYLLVCLAMSLLLFIMLWVVALHLGAESAPTRVASTLVATVAASVMFVKMMTLKIGTVVWTVVILLALVLSSVALNVSLIVGAA